MFRPRDSVSLIARHVAVSISLPFHNNSNFVASPGRRDRARISTQREASLRRLRFWRSAMALPTKSHGSRALGRLVLTPQPRGGLTRGAALGGRASALDGSLPRASHGVGNTGARCSCRSFSRAPTAPQ